MQNEIETKSREDGSAETEDAVSNSPLLMSLVQCSTWLALHDGLNHACCTPPRPWVPAALPAAWPLGLLCSYGLPN